MLNIINGASDKPVTSQRLRGWLSDKENLEGSLYIGYPIIGTVEGAYEIDALLVSQKNGIIAFNLVEGNSLPDNYDDIQDECFNMLEAKLKQYKELNARRELLVDISIVTFAPAINPEKQNLDDECPIIVNEDGLLGFLNINQWKNPELYNKTVSVIQAVSRIRVAKKRDYVKKEDSKGAILIKLDQSITNLDSQQSKAVLETVNGVQRIRGLAGSGKTIVLARKIAYLHAKNRHWKIAVTFNTRSLKNQFINLITSFVYEQTSESPDWDRIKIIHAWGSSRIEGMYYNACIDNNIEYLDFGTAKNYHSGVDTFGFVCKKFLKECNNVQKTYDLILIDEAQDFSVDFLRLCYLLLDDNKRLVYAYDELQTLTESSMPTPDVIWGTKEDGSPQVSLNNNKGEPLRDIILEKCYRNPGPVLSAAHALGFGIYRAVHTGYDTYNSPVWERKLVQMFDYAPLWEDIGYEVIAGELKSGEHVTLKRKREASPEFLETHSSIDEIISFSKFKNEEEQTLALVNAIEKNIKEDELRPEDIMVIHSDPFTTKTAVSSARRMLFDRRIQSTVAGVTGSPDDFFEDNSVMFTSIYRAKGNEAAMVYFINAQYCADGAGLGTKRNIMFTAMTRTKAWLRVFGHGDMMDIINYEYSQVKANDYRLDFNYPTEAERKMLRIVNRDMTVQEKNRINKLQSQLDVVAGELLSGEIHKEDLSPEILDKLRKALGL